MKTLHKITICLVALSFAILSSNKSYCQATGDNTTGAGKYLGFSGGQDLDFRTDNTLRMQLMQTQTNTINGFTGIAQGGFVGLSDELNFFNPGGTGPFSMLHLNGNNNGSTPQELGWRPWMQYGMTVTSNRDLMYVGHLDRGSVDETDAVITWSDNTFGPSGPDNLRFIFTSGDGTAAPGDEDSFYGLEAGRFSGEGNFGCGDFSASGTNEQPTHQLDVNGMTRVRDVPEGPHQVLITGREVNSVGDYVLHHLAFPDDDEVVLAGDGTWIDYDAECDWDIVNSDQDVATGFPGACVVRGTGIGTSTPESKLEVDYTGLLPEGFNDYAVEATVNTSNPNSPERIAVKGDARNDLEELIYTSYGGYFSAYGARSTIGVYGESLRSPEWNIGTVNTGVRGVAEEASESGENHGVSGFAENARENIGVRGRGWYTPSDGGPQPQNNYGVYGVACYAVRNYGVFGTLDNNDCKGYAGYFSGDLAYTGNLLNPSDIMLKTNVESFDTGLDLINQLSPKSYNFKTEEFSHMNLPEGMQYGLIAQEVQEILPNSTKTGVMPAQFDTEGNEVSPETEYLAVDYLGMVPVLISAVKEQQAIIDSQNETLAQVLDQLDDLQQQINNCCSADAPISLGTEEGDAPIFGENVLHQNNPNPFHSRTTIRYELEQGGKVMLNIFDRNGKPLATLVEAEQQAGEYRYEWDASGLPAGVYNYALYVDGELLVKKAIKLAD